jgi:hypothetical protein
MTSPQDPRNPSDPYTYLAVWGIPPSSREGFDLLVARQMLWQPRAAAAVRRLFVSDDGQPLCPACGTVVEAGALSVVCAAVLADRVLREQIQQDPTVIATRDPDALEAWWLLHGECQEQLTRGRVQELNQRIELALRAASRSN